MSRARTLLVVALVVALVFVVDGWRSSAAPTSSSGNLVAVSPTASSTSTSTSSTSTTSPSTTSSSTSTTVAPAPEVEAVEEVVLEGRDLGTFSATCYSLRGRTASGAPAGPGSIAVDPRIIPLGTVLEVEGYGRGVAADTGGAIKGRRLDVWMSSVDACREWGRRTVVVSVVG